MAEFGLILNLDLVDKMPERERAGFWPGLICGELYGELKALPQLEIREHIAPQKFSGIVPELLLRMAESLNRPMRTEDSSVFGGYVELIFGPCNPMPEWLTAEHDRRSDEQEGGAEA